MSGAGTATRSVSTAPVTEVRAPAGRHRKPGWTSASSGWRSHVAQTGLILLVLDAAIWLRELWVFSVIALVVLLTLPGYLALGAIGLRGRDAVRSPAWVAATSLAVITAVGLTSNLVGPTLGVEQPLQTVPLAVMVNVACLALAAVSGTVGVRNRHPSLLEDLRRAVKGIDRPGTFALILPVLATAGAARLSNGHGPALAAAGVFVSVAALGLAAWQAATWPSQRQGWVLYGVSAAVLLGYSMRSDYVFGWDISAEYGLLTETIGAGYWNPSRPNDAYGAMLSLTVLPTGLHALTGLSGLAVLKLVYPLLFALVPVTAFVLLRGLFGPRAALTGAALTLALPAFSREMPALARQEIALLMFVVLLSVLWDDHLPRRIQVSLAVLFSTGVVVSHYSTTYTMVTVLGGAVIVQAALSVIRRSMLLDIRPVVAVVTSIAVASLWYVGVTDSFGASTDKANRLLESGLEILPTAEGENLFEAYLRGPDPPERVSVEQYEQRVAAIYAEDRPWLVPAADDATRTWQLLEAEQDGPAQPPTALGVIDLATFLFRQFIVLLAVAGTALMLIRRTTSRAFLRAATYAMPSILLLVAIRVSPTVAGLYGQERLYVQLMPILAVPILWSLRSMWDRGVAPVLRRGRHSSRPSWPRRARSAASLVVCLGVTWQLGVATGLPAAALGQTSGNLSTDGEHVARFYVTEPEAAAARWLTEAQPPNSTLHTDLYGQLRIFAFGDRLRLILTDITPRTVDVNGWVLATRTNIVEGDARSYIDDQVVRYRFPREFLVDELGLVYSNGYSEVFHR